MNQSATHTPAEDQTVAIKRLNDHLRTTGQGGQTLLSAGVAALPDDQRSKILTAVAAFTGFNQRNDPYGMTAPWFR